MSSKRNLQWQIDQLNEQLQRMDEIHRVEIESMQDRLQRFRDRYSELEVQHRIQAEVNRQLKNENAELKATVTDNGHGGCVLKAVMQPLGYVTPQEPDRDREQDGPTIQGRSDWLLY